MPTSCLSNHGTKKNLVWRDGQYWQPIFCGNCGKDAGLIPEVSDFAFALCDACGDKWGPVANAMVEPDTLFYRRFNEATVEECGRSLTSSELVQVLDDVNHPLNLLARERRSG